ncbi:MAG: hypothetical protein QOE03_3319 [Micromonosporaceae bacterium]|nr:hypothetical protein [Micromonosporaceae bacterium]
MNPVPVAVRVRPRFAVSSISTEATALMVATLASAGLNLVFWLAAARLYPTGAVGRVSVAVSAWALLSGVGQLNLSTVLARFLPDAGRHTVRVLAGSYAAIIVASLIVGAGFVGLGFGDSFLGGGTGTRMAFVALVAVFALFVVQDTVLTTFRRTLWVPVENVSVSVGKLLGLLAFAAVGSSSLAITVGWVVPTAIAVGMVTVAVFGSFAPAQVRAAAPADRLPTAREFGAFVGAQYANNLVGTVATFAAPLVVVDVLGTRQAAYFNVPWLVIVTMQTLLWNILTPFLVHSVREPDQVRRHAARVLRIGAPVVGLGTVALVVAAPVVLGLQGAAFAAGGTPLLRVVALSFPATAVIVFTTGYALLERRLWRLVAIRTPAAVCFLGGAALLLPRLGVVAVGIAYVTVQTIVAAALLPGLVRRLRTGGAPVQSTPAAGRIPADDRNCST